MRYRLNSSSKSAFDGVRWMCPTVKTIRSPNMFELSIRMTFSRIARRLKWNFKQITHIREEQKSIDFRLSVAMPNSMAENSLKR